MFLKYKPIDVVLAYISPALRRDASDMDLKFYAMNAYRSLGQYDTQELVCCTLPIYDGEVELPDDVLSIRRMSYTEELDSDFGCKYKIECSCGSVLCDNVTESEDGCTSCNSCGECADEVKAFSTRTNSICKHTVHYSIYLNYLENYQPTTLGFKGNSRGIISNDCMQQCDEYVTFSPSSNNLLVQKSCGYLNIVYIAQLKDDKNNFLIPDDANLIRGLALSAESDYYRNMVATDPNYLSISNNLAKRSDDFLKAFRAEKLMSRISLKELDAIVGRKTHTQRMVRNGAIYNRWFK